MKTTARNTTVLDLQTSAGIRIFRRRLLAWYTREKRDLPWRKTRDPYRVWLSEIMLQQTRVAAVLEHYRHFLHRFPTVEKLAAAREASVLAAWSGLGYYRRARMLHAAAKKIAAEMQGAFPATPAALRTLPGVGRYTAAAVASIAFDQPEPVVDGNVERVLQRVTGRTLAERELWELAGAWLSPERPGDFNQAMMELGAMVCVPGQPLCPECPVAPMCRTRGKGSSPISKAPQHKRDIYYALDSRDGSVLLVKRPADSSLMPGMWELPEISSGVVKPQFVLRHSITTTDYTVHVLCIAPEVSGTWFPTTRLNKLPLTGLARKILRTAKIM